MKRIVFAPAGLAIALSGSVGGLRTERDGQEPSARGPAASGGRT